MSDIEDTIFDEYSDVEEYSEVDEYINDSDKDEEDEENEEDKDEEDENIIEIDQADSINEMKKIPNNKRVSLPYLTKYEFAKIIGIRAIQISKNGEIYTNIDNPNPISIAEKEFKEKKIPFIIRRHLPNNRYEDWKLEELILL
jgi:DNA-directed RNA polymerase I, II, and III subunit RPABC2